ncbi:MAG: tRNA (N6-threonylcarbamoyladenosine(37)-N6)-methyltransferase TrmO [Chlorobiales bacterium]|nr:tRNA (N6-threonylcarbamoyladenosine(37)-N6)-methyltransferase TrmO [Chlorobiales bacterium]
MPIQPSGAKGIPGTVKVAPEYSRGLKDVEGFSHLVLLYVFHLSQGYSLEVKPFLDDKLRGVFATRAPKRPNPIGFSIVRLVKVDANTLHIEDIDVVDGTPLLDIKPFVPDFDNRESEKIGWLSTKAVDAEMKKSDSRFT